MAVQPHSWTVVIVGRWNRAILTPAGIATRVFKDDPKQIFVAVPLDGVSPYQVKHLSQNIVAMTDETRLLIATENTDYETLGYAMKAGVNALHSLPETPVVAAGFNINFHSTDVPPEIATLLAANVDTNLADLGHPIVARGVVRSFEYGRGRLNVTVSWESDGFGLVCNFHRGSTTPSDLIEWLQTPTEEVKRTVQRVLDLLKIELEEPNHGEDGE